MGQKPESHYLCTHDSWSSIYNDIGKPQEKQLYIDNCGYPDSQITQVQQFDRCTVMAVSDGMFGSGFGPDWIQIATQIKSVGCLLTLDAHVFPFHLFQLFPPSLQHSTKLAVGADQQQMLVVADNFSFPVYSSSSF